MTQSLQLQFFCPRWGSEQLSWDEFLGRVRDEGYDGVEFGVAGSTERREIEDICNKAEQWGLLLLAQHYDTVDANFDRHYEKYHAWLDRMKDYPVVKINSQTGRDIFSFEQNEALIGVARQFANATGIEVVHETHRNKWSFAAHIAKVYLEKIPDLKITLDASHWVCVAETFLQDQPEAMDLAIERTGHIHARVGYICGPQVPDPRAPEWQEALGHHLDWWDAVVARWKGDAAAARRREQGDTKPLTITPEFGPYPYMVELPYSRQPIVSQWEVNAWMMRMLRQRWSKGVLLLLVLISSFVAMASDITIYVSPKAKGDGTKSHPASLSKAMSMLPGLKKENPKGSITIVLQQGEYELNQPLLFTQENGGTEALKIIFKAAPNEQPVISGGRRILLRGKGVLSADIASLQDFQPNDLYVNGKRATLARSPNEGFYKLGNTLQTVDSVLFGKGNSLQRYEIPASLDGQLSALTSSQLKQVRFTIYHKWDNTTRTIDSLATDGAAFYSMGKIWQPWNTIDEDAIFYVQNFPAALDTSNEWMISGNKLMYIPENKDVQQQEAVVPVVEKFVIVKGDKNTHVSNIVFQGIAFRYSNRRYAPFEPLQAAATIDAAVMIDDADNIQFNHCEIGYTGQYAVWLRSESDHCLFNHCYIHDLGGGGIRIGEVIPQAAINEQMRFPSGNTIDNCIIQSGGYHYPSAVGVLLTHTANNVVSHNDIADFRYTGVSVGWVWGYSFSPSINNKIIYNHIHHIGWGVLSDMAAVYTLGVSPGTEVSNNVVHDVYSYDYGGWGLYTDEGSTGIRMENNLVYNTKTGGFHQHYGKENIIRNNIIAFSKNFQAQYTRVEDHRSFEFMHNIIISDRGVMLQGPWKQGDVLLDSNCYWNMNNAACGFPITGNDGKTRIGTFREWQQVSGKDGHSILADPEFVDAKNRNFKLKNNSAANRVGFKPFDYTKAGVYGDGSWKAKAKLAPEIVAAFNKSVTLNMKP
ncbi:MAG: right-handed parallel beta-helix repeat-containing protein [Sphingobacteriales bacterium]|nr:right-handed parallel beta-helix repeat-containing protein [Sphingobacteriales bacterium]